MKFKIDRIFTTKNQKENNGTVDKTAHTRIIHI